MADEPTSHDPKRDAHSDPDPGASGASACGPETVFDLASAATEEDLQQRLDEALAEVAELKDQFLRARAESENVRRRAQEDVAKAHKFAIETFAEALLPVKDSLELALKVETLEVVSMREGVDATLRLLAGALEKNRVIEVDPTGQKFDPHLHQAISMVPGGAVPGNHVVSVLQKGYTINDRVLRPALVTVAQG